MLLNRRRSAPKVKQQPVPLAFDKVIQCAECREPMYRTKIYIVSDGRSMCHRCFGDPKINARVKCDCEVSCTTRNRILEDVIAKCTKSPEPQPSNQTYIHPVLLGDLFWRQSVQLLTESGNGQYWLSNWSNSSSPVNALLMLWFGNLCWFY